MISNTFVLNAALMLCRTNIKWRKKNYVNFAEKHLSLSGLRWNLSCWILNRWEDEKGLILHLKLNNHKWQPGFAVVFILIKHLLFLHNMYYVMLANINFIEIYIYGLFFHSVIVTLPWVTWGHWPCLLHQNRDEENFFSPFGSAFFYLCWWSALPATRS